PSLTVRGTGLEGGRAVRHAPAEGEAEGSVIRELLDAIVGGVGDEHVPAPVHRDPRGVIELTGPAAHNPGLTARGTNLEGGRAVRHPPAEGEAEGSVIRELLDAGGVQAGETIGYKDVPAPVHPDARGKEELPTLKWRARSAPERGDEGPAARGRRRIQMRH